jgi:hypothetical protein
MIQDRRNFLRASLGIGAAAGGLCRRAKGALPALQIDRDAYQPDEYERTLATTRHLDRLGRPRSWSVVRQGFLPISPERVLRFEPYGTKNHWICSTVLEPSHIRARLSRDASQSDYHRRAAQGDLSDEKLGLITKITGELARFYSVPEYWENWAFGMTMRESIGSTWAWRHLAEPQQWQHHPTTGTAKTIHTNANVDWWLILTPSGTMDWEPCDGEPTYVMLTHVLSGSYPDPARPNDYLVTLGLVGAGVRSLLATSPNALVELSQMNRVSAARLMNQHVISGLRDIEK